MKKIVTIVGARPQFIKAAVVSHAIRQSSHLKEIIVHTGQHYDNNMSQIFLDELEIDKIDYQLGVGSHSPAKQTADMLIGIENVLIKERPDWLLIYGDTNSTLAGALAAAKLHVPIAHVEAGLRSYNTKMPEEINRLVADQLSTILFTPTEQAVLNLKKEGYSQKRITEVGDVMYDAALFYGEKAKMQSNMLETLSYQKGEYILATIHRAENTDHQARLKTIFCALDKLCDTLPIVMPLHPRTRKMLMQQFPELMKHSAINIIEPVGFLDMVMLEKNAALIITDSGGVQKEAFFYHVPCLTLRDETEWVETVSLNWNSVISPDDSEEVHAAALKSLGRLGQKDIHPYGKGNAARLITERLQQGVA